MDLVVVGVLFTHIFPNKLMAHKLSILLQQLYRRLQHSTFHSWLAVLLNKVSTKGLDAANGVAA